MDEITDELAQLKEAILTPIYNDLASVAENPKLLEKHIISFFLLFISKLHKDELLQFYHALGEGLEESKRNKTSMVTIPMVIKSGSVNKAIEIVREHSKSLDNGLLFVAYFFVSHPSIDIEADSLTEEETEELIKLVRSFDDAYKDRVETAIEEYHAIEEFFYGQAIAKPADIKSVRINSTDFPIDKLNNSVWGLLENAIKQTEDGQISMLPVQKSGSKTPIFVQYAISFDDLEKNNPGLSFARKLTPYEKRVYIAAGALWNVKKEQAFTYSELYAAAGYIGRPGGNDTDKLAAALTKMSGTKIFVDNADESDNYNYPRFVYDGQLLPMERISKVENGKQIDALIHLFREPPLISYARVHKQITTISIKLLQSPLSKTDANIRLEDYFIDRIAKAKNDRQKLKKKRCYTQEDHDKKAKDLEKPFRMLLNTVYENTQIITVKQKQRANEKIRKLLDHYKTEKFIKDYSIDDSAINIVLP